MRDTTTVPGIYAMLHRNRMASIDDRKAGWEDAMAGRTPALTWNFAYMDGYMDAEDHMSQDFNDHADLADALGHKDY